MRRRTSWSARLTQAAVLLLGLACGGTGLALADGLDPAARAAGVAGGRGPSVTAPTATGPTATGPAADPTTAPLETDVPAVDTFRPTSLRLPGADPARIVPVGLRSDHSLVVPDDPAVVGWWTGGARAGDLYGSVVIAGHVDSRGYGLGTLARLRRLRIGSHIVLTAGAHRQAYTVVARHEVAQADLMAGAGAFDQQVRGRLVLITCGGAFDESTHHYEDNVVVVARPDASS